MPKILTGPELCDELQISASTLARYRANGSIPFLVMPGGRTHRYVLSEVIQALQADDDEDEDLESSGDESSGDEDDDSSDEDLSDSSDEDLSDSSDEDLEDSSEDLDEDLDEDDE